jgi:hypothetical protein
VHGMDLGDCLRGEGEGGDEGEGVEEGCVGGPKVLSWLCGFEVLAERWRVMISKSWMGSQV